MRIEHVAIWTKDLEQLKAFYETYFGAAASSKYMNPRSEFESYFLSFSSGARLEIMHSPEVGDRSDHPGVQPVGYSHLAFSVGSKERVKDLTVELREAGYTVASAPRTTGDGYFESVVLDPDGNRVEITI
jgi:lactoylglutathione lyase